MLTSSMKMIMRVPIWSKKKTVNPISSAHHNLTFPNSQPACKKKRRMERGDTHWRTVCITHPLLHCRFHSPLENVRGGRTGEGNLLVLGLDGGSAAKQKTPEPVNMSEKNDPPPLVHIVDKHQTVARLCYMGQTYFSSSPAPAPAPSPRARTQVPQPSRHRKQCIPTTTTTTTKTNTTVRKSKEVQ